MPLTCTSALQNNNVPPVKQCATGKGHGILTVFSPLADAGYGFSKAYVRGTREGEVRRLQQRHLVFSFLHPLVFCRMPLAKNTPLGVSLSPQCIVRQSMKFKSSF